MLFVAIFSFFLLALVILYGLFRIIFKKKLAVEKRLDYIANMETPQLAEPESGFGARVVIPFFNGVGRRILKLTPENSSKRRRAMLERAGYLKGSSYERWVAKKILMTVVMILGVTLLLYLIEAELSIMIFAGLSIFALIQVLYRFSIQKAISMRGVNMVRELPYALDLITVSVEAGLSLDGAIGRIVANIEGILSDEFGKTLKEMRMGIDKKKALKNMSDRCDVREITTLMSALIQADELGVSIGKVLRIEGAQLREKRKQAAREKAMKAPIKMLFPLVVFIFPAIFVVILGPAMIQIMTSL